MRKNNNKGIVRTITTGHIEGDMLGQVIFWLSERTNRKYAQRPHRTYKKTRKYTINELYIRGLFRATIEWFQTAPTALLRKSRQGISNLRKHFRNGN